MEVASLAIADVKLVRPKRFEDRRGYFSETYNRRQLAAAGIDLDFVQDNHSLSREALVLRGLHYQSAPHAQAKLVRVVYGRILDVAVDIRHGSPTFGKHVAVELSASDGAQILVPVGFAHGFITLEPMTEVAYKVTDYYEPECDRGILWNDPELAIDWPLDGCEPGLSDKDRRLVRLRDAPPAFQYEA
ncbi:MAG: dTDP-4-dehydrorhamnose 3,5-epimerase [Hyphomicrobiaceae bacterium]